MADKLQVMVIEMQYPISAVPIGNHNKSRRIQKLAIELPLAHGPLSNASANNFKYEYPYYTATSCFLFMERARGG